MGMNEHKLGVSRREAAEMVGISEKTITRLEAAGRWPRAVGIGRSRRYLLADIQEHLAQLAEAQQAGAK